MPVETLLTGLPLGQLSAGALVALIVLLILGRKLIPERYLLDAQAEAERWRQAYENERVARAEDSQQLQRLMEKTDLAAARDELVVSLLQSIREKAGIT